MEKESRWQREEVEPAKGKEELAKRENRRASEMHHVENCQASCPIALELVGAHMRRRFGFELG